MDLILEMMMSKMFPIAAWFRKRGLKLSMAVMLCPTPGPGDLEKILSARGKDVTVKFFASWCGSCVEQLESLRGKPRQDALIMLSTYDSPDAAIATLNKYQINQECFAGDSLARKLGVTHLPRTFVFSGGKFQALEKK